MKRFVLQVVCIWFPVAGSSSAALAQDTRSQGYLVHIPPRIVLRAPADTVIVHDGVSATQEFPEQLWEVGANSPGGVTVTFRTEDAFRSSMDSTSQRDAHLGLAVRESVGAAVWSVDVPEARTNHGDGRNQAVVQASSNTAGLAKLNLVVTFLGGERELLLDGDYTLTVTATVTSHD